MSKDRDNQSRLSAQEIANFLLKVINREHVLMAAGRPNWDGDTIYEGDGWQILLYVRSGFLARVDFAKAPDGREGYGFVRGEQPLDLIKDEQIELLAIVIGADYMGAAEERKRQGKPMP